MVVERLDERSYEVETVHSSSYRRNRVHLKRTNDPPPKLTFEESFKASSYPDDTGDRAHLEETVDAEQAPCIEPCKDTVEQDNDQIPFGAKKTRPSKGLCETLATEH